MEEIAGLVAELAALSGARVEKVHERDAHSLVLTLKVPRTRGPAAARAPAPSREDPAEGGPLPAGLPGGDPSRKLFLLLSARPRFERVHLREERGETSASPGPFTLALRSRIAGARLSRVRQPGRARAVEIDLEEPRGPGKPPLPLILAAELGGASSNLVLLEGSRRLIASLLPVRRGGEALAPGERYAPGAVPHPGAMAGVAASPWRYLPAGGDAPALEERPLAKLFPLNLALGRYCESVEAKVAVEARREDLHARISAALKKRRTLRSRLGEDLARAREGEESLRLGELLKGELPRLRKGMDRVEVVDYYSQDLRKVTIPLDPSRSPRENIVKCFQRHRKSQRALPVITERLARVEVEIGLLEELQGAAGEAEGAAALQGILDRSLPFLSRHPARPSSLPGKDREEASRPQGPLRFTSRDGLEILVGRSARENEELTFRIAHGNDLFLHVSGRPAAHVVVRTREGHPASLETLLDAAQLALYYSLPVRSRGGIARGAAGEVDYVEVKHVRKPRGGKPGEVLLARHKTLRVRLEEERLDRLRGGPALPRPEERSGPPD